jgi:ACDE family multidrug resistance protein
MKIVIVVGMGLATVSLIALRLQHSFFYLISFLVITEIGIGIALPSLDAIITERIEKDQRGTMPSFYSSIRFIGVVGGGPPCLLLLYDGIRPSNLLYFWWSKPYRSHCRHRIY